MTIKDLYESVWINFKSKQIDGDEFLSEIYVNLCELMFI